MSNTVSTLSSKVGKGIASGLAAQAVTVLLGLMIVPYMVRMLGNASYALLSFSLTFIGYMAYVDLGLSNSMVRFLAEYDGSGDIDGKRKVLSTCICLYPLLGLSAGAILALLTPYFVTRVLTLPPQLYSTALAAFYITAVGLPIVLIKAYFEAIPLAHQRVTTLNTLNVLVNGTKLAASAVLLYTGFGLVAIVTANVVMSLLHTLVLAWVSIHCLPPNFQFEIRLNRSVLKEMLSNGLFVSATNLANLIILNLDRLLIGVFLPINLLAYYIAPSELALRLWYIPTQVNRAHFPVFGYLWGQRDLKLMRHHFEQSVRQIVIGVTFIAICIVVYARPILRFWIGPDYAQASARALQMLTFGTLINCWSIPPYSLMIAIDRAKETAKVRFVTMILNTILCLVLIPRWGINGAAVACLAAYLIDMAVLYWIIERSLFAGTLSWFVREVIFPTTLICALAIIPIFLATGSSINGLGRLIAVCCGGCALYFVGIYFLALTRTERQSIRSFIALSFGS